MHDPEGYVILEPRNTGTLSQHTVTEAVTEVPMYNYVALPLVAFVVCGVIGNSMVCLSILVERRLQNVTNYFLFSLAVADLMVCVWVMPLSIVNEFHFGVWEYSPIFCKMYVSVDVFLSSVSIVHMSVISFDRYWGISRPLRLGRSKHVLVAKIVGVWLVTIIIACPICVLAIIDTSNVYQDRRCQVFNSYFAVYGSVATFFIPFILMAFTYTATVRRLQQQAQQLEGKRKASSNPTAQIALRRTMRPQVRTAPVTTIQHEPVQRTQSLSAVLNQPTNSTVAALMKMHIRNSPAPELPPRNNSLSTHHQIEPDGLSGFGTALKQNVARAKTLFGNRRSRESSAIYNEQKATKVLGVVFCAFFVCWVPFFTANVTLALCGNSCAPYFPDAVGSTLLWLGYMSSVLNPVIYTTFNKLFRDTFRRLVRLQCIESASRSNRQSVAYARVPACVVNSNDVSEAFTAHQQLARKVSSTDYGTPSMATTAKYRVLTASTDTQRKMGDTLECISENHSNCSPDRPTVCSNGSSSPGSGPQRNLTSVV